MTDGPSRQSLLADLAGTHPGKGYVPIDRYRDFRAVFTTTDAGKRVLQEILNWGNMFSPSATTSPIDPYLSAMNDGARNLALRILTIMSHEPPAARPTKAVKQTAE